MPRRGPTPRFMQIGVAAPALIQVILLLLALDIVHRFRCRHGLSYRISLQFRLERRLIMIAALLAFMPLAFAGHSQHAGGLSLLLGKRRHGTTDRDREPLK
jgi:hypothetical protein